MAVRFASDGTAFVAEKAGIVKRFNGVGDKTADIVLDRLSTTNRWGDRGMLGLAVDPGFPNRPFIYVSYTFDERNRWKGDCPKGNRAAGCLVKGRVSRIDVRDSAETVLVDDYCQQFASHSVGDLAFGSDGQLYASAGEGASFDRADTDGATNEEPPKPANPCGDPPNEGGALRSQDIRSSGDPLGLSGTVMRLDPNTPLQTAEYADRMVAFGFRNPFRIDVRPGTSEVWVGDVGWGAAAWEEINRTAPSERRNFGWPCFEGVGQQKLYAALKTPLCESLYAEKSQSDPIFAYRRNSPVTAGEPDTCGVKGQSISALQFYDGTRFPQQYRGALFFADYARGCVWVMPAGADGTPDPKQVTTFMSGERDPAGKVATVMAADLQTGPDGDLYYAAITKGEIRRVRWHDPAKITPSTNRGPAPLDLTLDGKSNDGLSYQWDLDGDGQYDDAGEATVKQRFQAPGEYKVALRISDPSSPGFQDFAETTIRVDGPPTATISDIAPTWAAGERIAFSGSGSSGFDGAALGADAMSWELLRCTPAGCSVIERLPKAQSGEFTAPEGADGWLVLRLTVTQQDGQSVSAERRIDPRTSTGRVEPREPDDRIVLRGATRFGAGRLSFDGRNDSVTYSTAGLDLVRGFTFSARVRPSRGLRVAPLLLGETAGTHAFAIRGASGERRARWRGKLRVDQRLPARRWQRVTFSWDGQRARLTVGKRATTRSYDGADREAIARGLARVQRIRVGGDPRSKRWFRGTITKLRITVRD